MFKKLSVSLAVIFISTSTFGQALSTTDVKVFDWWFYTRHYPDLMKAGINTEPRARDHWLQHGIKEGRQAKNNFNVRDYLNIHPDLVAAFGQNNYTQALTHYLTFGFKEGRRTIKANTSFSFTENENLYIGNENFMLRAGSSFAGSFDSLVYKDTEIINNHDSGRLLQTAVSFDGLGECNNPTEGGRQGEMTKGSSVLVSKNLTNSFINTKVQAANWLSKGQTSVYCGNGKTSVEPVLSDTFIEKTATIGFNNDPNIIKYDVTVTNPIDHKIMQVEALTGYHQPILNHVYEMNFEDGQTIEKKFISLDGEGGDLFQNLKPAILASADQQIAIGTVALDFSNYENSQQKSEMVNNVVPRYMQFAHLVSNEKNDPTTKWSIVFTHPDAHAGKYHYQIFVVLGNLTEVKAKLYLLIQNNKKDILGKLLKSDIGEKTFDAHYYADRYPDLYKYAQYNEKLLLDHYLVFGFNEAREAGALFNG
ncbi:MAG: hypothetical protein Q7U04_15805, partial [Bacteriovorax sp.]|nr:hypothetical protein [Bacteriovorax sp.]